MNYFLKVGAVNYFLEVGAVNYYVEVRGVNYFLGFEKQLVFWHDSCSLINPGGLWVRQAEEVM